MGFLIVLLYVGLYLLSPADMFPALAPYHVLLILAVLTIPLSLLPLLESSVFSKVRTQAILVAALYFSIVGSWIPHGWFGGMVMGFTSFAPNVIVYFVGIIHFSSVRKLNILRLVLVSVAVYILMMAFSQIPEARATGEQMPYVLPADILEDITSARIRGLGVLNDPNFLGQFLLMLLPMLFVSNKPAGMRFGHLLAIPVALFLLFGIYMTNSRGAELGVLLLLVIYLVQRYKLLGIGISSVLATAGLLVLNARGARTISISGGIDRLMIWSDGLGMLKGSPLWGIGYYGFVNREVITAHNSFLLCVCELGLIGFFFWMSVMVVGILQLNRVPAAVAATEPALAGWAKAIRMSLFGYLFTSFFISRAYDLPLYLLLGMGGAVVCRAGGEETSPLRGSKWAAWALGLCIAAVVLIYVLVRLRAV